MSKCIAMIIKHKKKQKQLSRYLQSRLMKGPTRVCYSLRFKTGIED